MDGFTRDRIDLHLANQRRVEFLSADFEFDESGPPAAMQQIVERAAVDRDGFVRAVAVEYAGYFADVPQRSRLSGAGAVAPFDD